MAQTHEKLEKGGLLEENGRTVIFSRDERGARRLADALNQLNSTGSLVYFGESLKLPSAEIFEQELAVNNAAAEGARSDCFPRSRFGGEESSNNNDDKFVILEPEWLMVVIRSLLRHDFKIVLERQRDKSNSTKQIDLVIGDSEIDDMWEMEKHISMWFENNEVSERSE